MLDMQVFNDETEFTDIHVIQRVVDLFGNQPQMQRIITFGLLGLEYDSDLDEDDYDSWTHRRHSFNEHFGNNGISRNHSRLYGSTYHYPFHYSASLRENSSPPSYKVQDSEQKERRLKESKKSKEKAEKKRLKKQKRKLRKQMEKTKLDQEISEEGNIAGQSEKSKSDDDEDDEQKKNLAAAKDTDSNSSSSGEEPSDENDTKNDDLQELDMTSMFVTKAALIAQRKLEQKAKSENRDTKKNLEKERSKSVLVKQSKEVVKEALQTNSAVSTGLALENNVKISTDLAILGNKFASEGNYNQAVKYFTDAIKYNPKEFKFFGNRSFCFEKIQEYEKALADADLALSVSPGWVKGLFRKGRALAGLKRYTEAADAFRDVLKRDTSYAEAAQELMRVQILELMGYGFTREQSSKSLIIHGTLEKALEVLYKLHSQPGAVVNGPLPPARVANVTGISPVLSAKTNSGPVASAQSNDASKKPLKDTPLGSDQNIPDVYNQSKPVCNQAVKMGTSDDKTQLELFPVWIGNLSSSVTGAMITTLFSKAGPVSSVKLLTFKQCAFVNFTKQEHCDDAIKRLNGYELHGIKIVVRYPDRIAPGMGISRSALRARDLHNEDLRQYSDGRKAAGN